jgi:hypothetical protein
MKDLKSRFVVTTTESIEICLVHIFQGQLRQGHKDDEDYFQRLKNTSKEKEAAANAKFRKLISEKANPGKRTRVS